jgi:hypothetical protein
MHQLATARIRVIIASRGERIAVATVRPSKLVTSSE